MDPVPLPARKGVPLRILVTRLRYLGDVILTTPVIDALRDCFPEAEIWYMAESPHSDILEHHPGLSGIVKVGGTLSTAGKLRKLRFAAAIDLFYNPRSANILRLSGIPVRIGGGRKWRRRLYTHIIEPDRKIRSAISHHLAALGPLGCDAHERRPRVYLTEGELAAGRDLVRNIFDIDMPERIVAIHAGGTWPAKRWPVSSFAELARIIDKRYGAKTLMVTGPGEESISRQVSSDSEGRAVFMKPAPLRTAASAVAACGALVSNDGGVMHMGVALGVPTVGIFGPTEPDIWFPYSGMGPFELITRNEDCMPCHLHECGDMKCLENISPAEVADGLAKVTGW